MSKKHISAKEKIDKTNPYDITEAVDLIKKLAHTKFDETVDLAINLGVDPRKSDQAVDADLFAAYGCQ